MTASTSHLDPVTLAVVYNGLMSVAGEMDLTQERLSFSPIISEAMDRANGIYRPDNGEIVVQGRRGLPIFVGVMQATVASLIASGADYRPGDIIIVNDPYFGGTHLMDVKLIKPVFHDGRIWCYLGSAAHWADIGGSVPGGFSTNTTEIQQEGLRLTPLRLCRDGALDEELLAMILANCRAPEERVGDLKAQIGALNVGERQLSALLARYGVGTVEMAMEELNRHAEEELRARIAEMPDGTYRFRAFLDSDGVEPDPVHVEVAMRVADSDLHFDFSQSSPPCKGPLNTPWAATRSAVYIAVRHMFPDIELNSGFFRPISIAEPRGTFLYAEYPRPVAAAAAECSQRVVEAVLGAFGQVIPERAYAGAFGTAGNLSLGGWDPQQRRHYVMYYFSGGGYGGSYAGDGHSNACATISFAAGQPVEILEQHYPVIFEHFALRPDSGGAGRHRGGLGIDYKLRLRDGEARTSFMMEHGRFAPYALLDGKEGALTEIELSQRGQVSRPEHVSKGSGYTLAPGDWIRVRTPGGGGYGPPQERDRALIARDLERGLISAESARRDYVAEEQTPVSAEAQQSGEAGTGGAIAMRK